MFVYYTLKQYQTFFYLRCYGRRYKEGRLTKVVNEHSEQYSEGCVVTEIGFDGLTKNICEMWLAKLYRYNVPMVELRSWNTIALGK